MDEEKKLDLPELSFKDIQVQNALTNAQTVEELDVQKVKVIIDPTKSVDDQIRDISDAKVTADALKDEDTHETLVGLRRSKEISEKVVENNNAQAKVTESKTAIDKAEHEQYAGILETFGFYENYPAWMTKIITYLLTPFQLVIGFIIGLFCGTVKILIDNVEGIVTKYDKFDEKKRPKIKVTIIIILVLASIAAICLTTLACLHII